MSKRVKTVFDTDQIAHLWAHAVQLSARNPQGNHSFAGIELRSYNAVIGQRITHKGKTVFLELDHTWTVTTSRHQHRMRMAMHGEYRYVVAEFPPRPMPAGYDPSDILARKREIVASHKRNLAAMLAHAEKYALKSKRARTNAEWYAKDAARWYNMAISYAACFGVRAKIKPLDVAALANAAKDRAAKVTEAQRKATAQRKALNDAINASIAANLPHFADEFRASGRTDFVHTVAGRDYGFNIRDYRYHAGTDLMRLDGDDVQTSLGVRVAANVVRRIAPLLIAAMTATTAGDDLRAKFVGRHVGAYRIDAVEFDGVKIGCHTFRINEVRSILAILERAEIVPATIDVPQDGSDVDASTGIDQHDSNGRA